MSTIWEVDDAEDEIEGLDAAGRADPAYAAALGLLPAPFGRRFSAVTVDVAVYLIVQIPFWVFAFPLLLMFARSEISLYGLVTHPSFFLAAIMAGISALLTLALLIVQGVFQGRMGVTIGKGIFGIRSVNVERLDRPGFWRIVLRTLIVSVSNVVPLIGPALLFLSAMSDTEHRGRAWHDHASHVWLIDVNKGLNPYDGKRMRIARKVVKVEVAPQAQALPSLATAESSGTQPAYRPAHSVSAGVLGIAKPRSRDRDDSVGIVAAHPSADASAPPLEEGGVAVVGGYRADRAQVAPLPDAVRRASQSDRVVLGVPADLAAAPVPQQPVLPAPTPQQPVPASTPQHPPAPAPASTPQQPVAGPSEPSRIAVRLTLDTGGEFVLTEPTIFGRHPEENADFGAAQCVPVPDDTRSVSKTHFALRPLAAGVEVRDLGSTNGTYILRGGVERQAEPGVSLVAAPGDVVRFGDRTISIGAA